MNERIRELAIECYQAPEFDYKKFAELIVTECIEVCHRGKYDGREDMSLIQFNNGIQFCINAIDEHFGD